MNNLYQSDETTAAESWSAQASPIPPVKKSSGARFMDWWHSIASPPELPANATVIQREKHRHARSVSVVVLTFFPVILAGLPTTTTMPNPWIFWTVTSILVALIIAPFLNRIGQVYLAGMLVILSFQFTIMFLTVTTMPLNETGLQYYDVLTLVILLALVILPLRAIWVLAIADCIFVVLDLLYQPRTESFTQLLEQEGLMSIMIRPLALIVLLTGVSTFLLVSVAKAVRQSYEAEFVAKLERASAMQSETEVQEKHDLEESIQQIVQAHTDTMNGRMKERIPYPTAKVLWPLVGILNTLWTRLQRSQQREQEFAQLQKDIAQYNEVLQHSVEYPDQPLVPYQTKTMLAPLTLSITRLHRELLNRIAFLMKK